MPKNMPMNVLSQYHVLYYTHLSLKSLVSKGERKIPSVIIVIRIQGPEVNVTEGMGAKLFAFRESL